MTLFGMRWHRREEPPDSEEVAAAWGTGHPLVHRAVRRRPVHVREQLPGRPPFLRLHHLLERVHPDGRGHEPIGTRSPCSTTPQPAPTASPARPERRERPGGKRSRRPDVVLPVTQQTPNRPPLSVLDLAIVVSGGTSAQALADATAVAQKADALGYQRFWVAEHHNMPSVASTTPPVLMAHLAARTERIRVGSGGIMLPNHPRSGRGRADRRAGGPAPRPYRPRARTSPRRGPVRPQPPCAGHPKRSAPRTSRVTCST